MSLLTPEVMSVFGTLDSDDGIADGDLPDAAALRVLCMAANRALAQPGDPLLNIIYDSGGAVAEAPAGGIVGFGQPTWMQIVAGPLTREKKPGLTKATLYTRFYARSGETLFLQVATNEIPFRQNANGNSVNCLEITGTGSFADLDLADIPINYGATESISVYLRGMITSTVGVTGTYGSPNTGTISSFDSPNVMVDSTTPGTWNTTGNTWDTGGHGLTIADATGNLLAPVQWIVGVPTATRLYLYPGLHVASIRRAAIGATYRIFELPRWRATNFALYPQARAV